MADDVRPLAPKAELYEADFYVWTQTQAAALRAAGASKVSPGQPVEHLDWLHLAEEVEDLGRSNLNAAASLVQRILEHLFLLESSGREEPKRHWRAEIVAFRKSLRRELSPSIRRKLQGMLEELHRDACDVAAAKLAAFETGAPAPDPSLRWTLEAVIEE